ncbi:MAG: hypothetical protein V4597_19375, partial [Pseudomonadota bacterium]
MLQTFEKVARVYYAVAARWLPQGGILEGKGCTWLQEGEHVRGIHGTTLGAVQRLLGDLVANNQGLVLEDFKVVSAWVGMRAGADLDMGLAES